MRPRGPGSPPAPPELASLVHALAQVLAAEADLVHPQPGVVVVVEDLGRHDEVRAPDLGFGRTVASEIELPDMLANLV